MQQLLELSLTISELTERFNYFVLPTEVDRFLKQFDGDAKAEGFYELDVYEKKCVWLNKNHLVVARVLNVFPPLLAEECLEVASEVTEDDSAGATWRVKIWCEGVEAPLVCDGITEHDWIDIYCALNQGAGFIQFEDEDAEMVIIRSEKIKLVEAVDKSRLSEAEGKELYSEDKP